ncbi:MAG: DMT family transporter [Chitinophagales bacterium]|nr:DMT family transporter [Bacteroidota bacterium]MCB9043665.1 DMT family transporter [Chitinophagales bacterium]
MQWFLLILLSVIWGSSFILIKKALVVFPPEQVAALRIFLAFAALLPVAGRGLRHLQRSNIKYAFVVGAVGSGIPAFLFATAQTHINSGTSGVLNSLTPLSTFVIGVLLFNTVFKWQKLLGVLIGLSGALTLILFSARSFGEQNLFYSSLIVLATICYAISVNVVKKYCQNIPSATLTMASFSLVMPFAVIYLLFFSNFSSIIQQPNAPLALGYIAILAGVGTALANSLFFYLTQQTNALFASSVTYGMPLVALSWGFLDGEPLSIIHFVAFALIISGVYLIYQS